MGVVWREAMHRPLGEVFSFRNEIVHPKDRPSGRCTFVGLEHVESNTGLRIGSQSILLEELSGRRARFKRGDIVYGYLRPYLNKVWVAEFDGICSVDQYVLKIGSNIDSSYLSHYLRSTDFLQAAPVNDSPGQLPRIRSGELAQTPVPLPPIDEQRRIAAILDQADELRRKRGRAINRLDQLGQTIFYEMFGDLTTNPMGWDTVKLGDLCAVGSSKRVFVEDFVDEGVPFYRGTEVGKLATREAVQPNLFITLDHYEDLISHSGKPEIGDLLLPSICHDGRIWCVDSEKPFYFKDGRVLWIKKNESVLDSEYLRNHLRNALLRNYASIASGTTFAELKIVNLKGLPILCPPLELQAAFSKKMREVEVYRLSLVRSEMAVKFLFASLQHRAFNGELTAKVAERELAEVG